MTLSPPFIHSHSFSNEDATRSLRHRPGPSHAQIRGKVGGDRDEEKAWLGQKKDQPDAVFNFNIIIIIRGNCVIVAIKCICI